MRAMPSDQEAMERVLELAARGWGATSPNPMVGALIRDAQGVLGEGWHRRAGAPHAEPEAVEQARASDRFRDASCDDITLYVNLEPCVHQGRTPPCTQTLRQAPIGRVVVAMLDPDPRVRGRGVEALRAAGVRVEVGTGFEAAHELNHAFVARQLRGRPFVALKVALSADGCIAHADGAPAAITGEEARRAMHRVRAGYDAILVGVETVRRDRPRLDRRVYDGPGTVPQRIVLDPTCRCQPDWIATGPQPIWLVTRPGAWRRVGAARAQRLAMGVEPLEVPLRTDRDFDLHALLAVLAERGVHSVLVEGGGETHRRFFEQDAWDRVMVLRRRDLRLQGLAWSAASAWSARVGRSVPVRRVALTDREEMEIRDHPASRLTSADAFAAPGARAGTATTRTAAGS